MIYTKGFQNIFGSRTSFASPRASVLAPHRVPRRQSPACRESRPRPLGAACTLQLGALDPKADKSQVNLYLNGEVISFDAQATKQTGWGFITFYREFGDDGLLLDVNYLSNLFQRELAQATERIFTRSWPENVPGALLSLSGERKLPRPIDA